MITGQYSIERLVHFQCGKCRKWWTIGDAPDRNDWYCPWCGEHQTVKQAEPIPMTGEAP